jgi:hypothetical protein
MDPSLNAGSWTQSNTIDSVGGPMKSSRFAVLALLSLLAPAVASCGRGNVKNPEASAVTVAGSTTSIGSSAGVAPTVPVPAPATPAAETGGLDTIEAANQNLWDAWRDDDRPRALAYATTAAVESLFLSKWGPEVRNQGCGTGSGIPRCVYTLRGGARVVIMGQNTTGFFAQRVETVGALPSSNRLRSEIVDDTVVFDETANAEDPALSSDAISSDAVSQDGIEVPLTLAPGSEDLSGEVINGSSGSADGTTTDSGASDPTNNAKPRAKNSVRTATKATKAPKASKTPKATKRQRKTTEAPSVEQTPEPAAPAPSPSPAPAPEAGPVQAGRTVETVAP